MPERQATANGTGAQRSVGWIEELGLRPDAAFLRDARFYGALAAAPLALALLKFGGPVQFGSLAPGGWFLVWAVLWQPLVEELLFRGVIQGQLARTGWGQRSLLGMNTANLAASLLFAAVHLFHYPAWQAAAVFVPSLVFGHFYRRHRSVYPSIVLHAFYNAALVSAAALQA